MFPFLTSRFSSRATASAFSSGRKRRVGNILPLCGLAFAALFQSGCFHRRLTVHSDPPGALVLVDGKEIGYTPASMDFTYYGTREITLIKDGFETLTVLQKVRTPWYEIPPLDFVTDNFIPFQATDRHSFSYHMQPQVVVPKQELLDRADSFRSESQVGP